MTTKTPGWDELVAQWLHGRPESTQYVYGPVIADFRLFIKNRPIGRVGIEDIQKYRDNYSAQKPRTIERAYPNAAPLPSSSANHHSSAVAAR